MGQHAVDANTQAMWRLDETVNLLSDTVLDTTSNNYDFTQATWANRPRITGGPKKGEGSTDYARYNEYAVSAMGMTAATDANMVATLVGEYTFECWVYMFGYTAGTRYIFSANGIAGSELQAENFLLQVGVLNTTGYIQAFWEHSTGTNVTLTQTAGVGIPLHAWTHVGLKMTQSGTTQTMEVHINGVSQDSPTGHVPDGGANAVMYLGNANGASSAHCAISALRISSVALATSVLLTNATNPDFTLPNDANTEMLLEFGEAPQFLDSSGNGNHAWLTIDSATTNLFRNAGPIVTDEGQGVYHQSGSANLEMCCFKDARETFHGDWTLELWWHQNGASFTNRGIMEWPGTGSELEVNNYLCQLYMPGSASVLYKSILLWETGAGTNVTCAGAVVVVEDDKDLGNSTDLAHHLAFVSRDAGGGDNELLVYVDGVLIETITGGVRATGGSGEVCNWWLFRANNSYLFGWADDVRFSDKERTQPEIQTSFEAGIATGSGDATPPTFTVVSPTEGTPIQPSTTLVVRVQDNVAVALAPIYAEFPGHPVAELVYNGTAFFAPYAASSSVIDLGDGGRELSVVRDGGWPGAVNLTSIATDTSGNEVA